MNRSEWTDVHLVGDWRPSRWYAFWRIVVLGRPMRLAFSAWIKGDALVIDELKVTTE